MKTVVILLGFLILLFASCTFEYDDDGGGDRQTPDLIMTNVEYVRVRSSDPVARFVAERAERFEGRGIMLVQNFTFEQYGDRGNEVNSFGSAGSASIDTRTGNVSMDDGVRLEIESEDIILETRQLHWEDEPRILTSGAGEEVRIFQDNGTNFTGIDLRVEARARTWSFGGHVSGVFISDEEEDEEAEARREAQREARLEARREAQREILEPRREVYIDEELK